LHELHPVEKPPAMIKRIKVWITLESEDWWQRPEEKGRWRDRWQGAAVGTLQRTGGGPIEAAIIFESGLDTTGPVTGTMEWTETTISEITIKGPRGTGRAKWTLKYRETINQGVTTKAQMSMEWMERGRGMANEQSRMLRKQIAGQIGWADLMKYPKVAIHKSQYKPKKSGNRFRERS
jgi:hypothetical protein